MTNLSVLNCLDLSLCVVRDIGSISLSITRKGNPGCVRSLDFSNNQNLDNDSSVIGKTFHSRSNCGFDNINRDNNSNIGDKRVNFLVKTRACSSSLRS